MSNPKCVVLKFQCYEDERTLARRVEAKAIDPETSTPVVSLSLEMMYWWLVKHNYHWRVGSSGIYDKVA